MAEARDLRLPSPRTVLRVGLQGVVLVTLANAAILLWSADAGTWRRLLVGNGLYLPLLLALVAAAWALAGARVLVLSRALGHRLRYREALVVSLSSQFGTAATPAGIGAILIRLGLLRRAGIPLGRGAAMFTVDSAIDLAFYALLVPLSLWLIARDEQWREILARLERAETGWLLPAIGVVAIVATGVTWFLRRRAGAVRELFERSRMLREATRELDEARSALRLLLRERRAAVALDFVLGVSQWCCRYGTLPLILLALGIAKNPAPLILLQGGLFAISSLVVVPGGGGGVEAVAAFVLQSFVPLSLVGVVLFVWRLFTYYLYLIVGGAVFFWTCKTPPKKNAPLERGA